LHYYYSGITPVFVSKETVVKNRDQSLIHVLTILLVLLAQGIAKEPIVEEQALAILTTAEKYHYLPIAANDRFSRMVFESFINTLDPYGLFFSTGVIDSLKRFTTSIDDEIKQKKTHFLDTVTSIYQKQVRWAERWLNGATEIPYDFSRFDTIWFGGDSTFVDQKRLSRKWELWIKYMVLRSLQTQGDTLNKMTCLAPKIAKIPVKEAVSRELCRIQAKMNHAGGIDGITHALYLKAIAKGFDPHTEYLTPVELEERENELSQTAAFIGIELEMNSVGEIEITGVLPGSSAWHSNKINPGDVILSIRKPDGTLVDLRCVSVMEVQELLESIGFKKVWFKIRNKNGSVVQVALQKEMLDVEENTIHSYLLKGKRKIGYIYLPSFYTDFNLGHYLSKGCANDMAKELIKLKRECIDGLVVDVRWNGGGLLSEACRLAGIFIDQGALTITQKRGKPSEIEKDKARGSIYNGPLVVLCNSYSASASELFLAVLQDYNRGVIVGSKTFGKGTIQSVLPVDAGKFDSLSHYKGEPSGFLTITTGGFYRVSGKSHQKTGIFPDVELPDMFENAITREDSYLNPLELKPLSKKTYFQPGPELPLRKLMIMSSERVNANPVYRFIRTTTAFIPKLNQPYPIPLSFEKFVDYATRSDNWNDSLRERKSVFTASPIREKNSQIESVNADSLDRAQVIRDLQGDIYINEGYAILSNLIEVLQPSRDK
jgi:carboxyl-terminal processing protease